MKLGLILEFFTVLLQPVLASAVSDISLADAGYAKADFTIGAKFRDGDSPADIIRYGATNNTPGRMAGFVKVFIRTPEPAIAG